MVGEKFLFFIDCKINSFFSFVFDVFKLLYGLGKIWLEVVCNCCSFGYSYYDLDLVFF